MKAGWTMLLLTMNRYLKIAQMFFSSNVLINVNIAWISQTVKNIVFSLKQKHLLVL